MSHRFIQELLPKMNGRVYIPKVYHEMTTRKVLVTEWIEGQKLASSPKEVRILQFCALKDEPTVSIRQI